MPAPTFSYAQAAKGRTPAPASSPSPAADPHIKDDASSVTTAADASAKTFSTTSEVSESVKSSQIEADLGTKKSGENGSSDPVSPPAKNDVATSQDNTTNPNHQSGNESSGRQANRSSEPNDARKSRKGKKARSSEKDTENEQAATELEKEKAKKDLANLVESAPPAVNFWHQRAEANAKQPNLISIMVATDSKIKPTLDLATKTASNAEASEIERGPNKGNEASRATDDQSVRKSRSNRSTEKSERVSIPSSAVEDATSWPTPDTVVAEDEKRKTTVEPDSKEKQDDGNKAPRSIKNWKKMEIIPTVVFATQIPARNPGKPRGTGQTSRGAGRVHSGSLSLGAEKPTGTAQDVLGSKEGVEPQVRVRDDVRALFPPPEKSKKFGNAEQPSQRKQSVPSGTRSSGLSDFVLKNENTKTSTGNESTVKKDGFNGHHTAKPKRGAHANGRGGHNGQQQPYISNGNGPTRNNHSPQAPAYGATYSTQYGGNRGRGRPGPGANGFKGPTNGMGKMHTTQHPQQAGAEYGQYPAVYSQAPFPLTQTTAQQAQQAAQEALIMKVLRMQAEYYFSDENLIKDDFLKRHMDAQGFVAFEIIANFRRMQVASGGDLNFIRSAVLSVASVEYVMGDGRELVRRRVDWNKWVLPGITNPGPTQITPVTSPQTLQNQFYQPMAYSPYDLMSQQHGSVFPAPDMHMGYMNRHQFSGNGVQMNHHITNDNSALNVSAPAFSPIQSTTNGFLGAYPQLNWEVQVVKGPEAVHNAEGQDSTHPTSDKLPNGIAESAMPVQTNGTHVNTQPSAVPEVGLTNGVTTSSTSNTQPTPISDDKQV